MSTPEKQPHRYAIEGLLASGQQPLPDLNAEDFAGLRRAVGKGPLADPISISADGVLIDGHQRLKALLANGRKFIDAGEVHVVADADRSNALDYAVQLNLARRHLTVEQKADLARWLQRERRWSQGRIARAMGVSRPAVGQWLAKHPDPDPSPVIVAGLVGKTYVNEPTPPRPAREPRSPWRSDGYAYKAVHRALGVIGREPLGGLDNFQSTRLAAMLEDVIAACEDTLSKLSAGEDSSDDAETADLT